MCQCTLILQYIIQYTFQSTLSVHLVLSLNLSDVLQKGIILYTGCGEMLVTKGLV